MTYGTLIALAKAHNTTVVDLIIETVKEVGSINQAALKLGVANNAIRHHIKRHGLVTIRANERTELRRPEAVS